MKRALCLNELKAFELLSAVIVKRKTDSYQTPVDGNPSGLPYGGSLGLIKHMRAPWTNSPDLNLTTLAVFYLIFFRAQRCARKET